ncbi:MAG: hypothetical protein LUE12_08170 [Ruminococcus sp.]|nr:hypothetical protein [Ruminococcus sp.]
MRCRFRLDSPIELCRFRKSYADIQGEDVNDNDDEIISTLDGFVFSVTTEHIIWT